MRVAAICAGSLKGAPKRRIGQAQLVSGFGLSGDCDAGLDGPQLSLLPEERFAQLSLKTPQLRYGQSLENFVIEGLDNSSLAPGTRLRLGDALIELTCPSPQGNGLHWAKVILGGIVTEGDPVAKE
jgi:hypothetical protein